MRRGWAITVVYLVLLGVPALLIALIFPPLVTEANDFAQNVPSYARDVTEFVEDNKRLREINDDYDITQKLEEEAGKLPSKLGGAAKTLRDVGFGIVNSVFALLTILVLTAFLLANGRRWIDSGLALQPPERAQRIRRTLERMAAAVGGYVAGALLIAVIAGVSSYIVMTILGVDFRAPLALIVGLFAIGMGIQALMKISKQPALGGRGKAIAGIILGSIGFLLWVTLFAAFIFAMRETVRHRMD